MDLKTNRFRSKLLTERTAIKNQYFALIFIPLVALRIFVPFIFRALGISDLVYCWFIVLVFTLTVGIRKYFSAAEIVKNQWPSFFVAFIYVAFVGSWFWLFYIQEIPTDPVYAWFVRLALRLYQLMVIYRVSKIISEKVTTKNIVKNTYQET